MRFSRVYEQQRRSIDESSCRCRLKLSSKQQHRLLHHISVFLVFLYFSLERWRQKNFNEINLKTFSSPLYLSRSQLKCSANIHEIYRQSDERFIEEIRPKILATGASSMNMYHSVLDGESLTDPNVGMTQSKGNWRARVNQKLISAFEELSSSATVHLFNCWALSSAACALCCCSLQSRVFFALQSMMKILFLIYHAFEPVSYMT